MVRKTDKVDEEAARLGPVSELPDKVRGTGNPNDNGKARKCHFQQTVMQRTRWMGANRRSMDEQRTSYEFTDWSTDSLQKQ